MDSNQMIDDIVKMLDAGISEGVGHVNVDVTEAAEASKNVQTLGCTDCNSNSMACSVPTMEQGLDDFHS